MRISGPRCEININDCLPNPCYVQGGAQCVDKVNGFDCICNNPIWTGPLCNRRQLCLPPGKCQCSDVSRISGKRRMDGSTLTLKLMGRVVRNPKQMVPVPRKMEKKTLKKEFQKRAHRSWKMRHSL